MFKAIERWGRLYLTKLFAFFLRSTQKDLTLGTSPKILIIRLDQRVGNLIMLTPMLHSLKSHFGECHITLLAQPAAEKLLGDHPCIDELMCFRKNELFGSSGPLQTLLTMRRNRFDLVIDGGNPTDPSTTQSLLTRFSGGKHTLGFAHGPFAGLYSFPHPLNPDLEHEIDMRLDLLNALPNIKLERQTSLTFARQEKINPQLSDLLEQMQATKYLVINCGARLSEKSLSVENYAEIARLGMAKGFTPLLTYGPTEIGLARNIKAANEGCNLAPETNLIELAMLMQQASAVVACDTGPMHIAVAVGTPTLGIFMTTSPQRYGYDEGCNTTVDLASLDTAQAFEAIKEWLASCSNEEPSSYSKTSPR